LLHQGTPYHHNITSSNGNGSKGNGNVNKGVRRGTATAAKRAMVTAMRVAGEEQGKVSKGDGNCNDRSGNKEGDGEGGKSNGDDNKDGRQSTGTMAMVAATTRAMVMVARWWATNRAMARAARAMVTAMKIADDEEGNSKGGKSNGDGKKGGRQQRGQQQGWQGKQWQ
jgi:hypothetical protein